MDSTAHPSALQAASLVAGLDAALRDAADVDVRLAWSRIAGVTDTRPQRREGSLSDLVRDLVRDLDCPTKIGPAIVVATFAPGGPRQQDVVDRVYLAGLDIDEDAPSLSAADAALGCAAVAHGSYSDRRPKPIDGERIRPPELRYRLLVPLARAVTLAEHKVLLPWLTSRFKAATGCKPCSCSTANQPFFTLRSRRDLPDPPPWIRVRAGDALDPDDLCGTGESVAALLAFEEARGAEEAERQREARDAAGPVSPDLARRRAAGALRGAEERMAAASERHPVLIRAAMGLAPFVRAGWATEDEAIAALWAGGQRAGMGQRRRREVERAMRSAIAKCTQDAPRERPAPATGGRKGAGKPRTTEAQGEVAVPPDLPAALSLTDSGNAQRLVERCGSDLRFCADRGKWLRWDGARWAEDAAGLVTLDARDGAALLVTDAAALRKQASKAEGDEAKALAAQGEALLSWAKRSVSSKGLAATLNVARVWEGVSVTQADLDRDPFVLCCPNGLVDLRTGELRPPDRGALCTKMAGAAYDPAATAPRWERFLLEVMQNRRALVDFLKRAAGYAATGLVREHVWFFLYGGGRNGKGTTVESIARALAEYARTVPTSLVEARYEVKEERDFVPLIGRRFVFTSEVEDSSRLAEAKVKKLTGGDTLPARFNYGEQFDFPPTHTLFVSGNHKPIIRGTDEGVWSRILLVPFERYFAPEERDQGLPETLRRELPGILRWIVEGAVDYFADGLRPPADVTAAVARYRDEQDATLEFLRATTAHAPDEVPRTKECPDIWRTSKADLFAAYEHWCERTGIKSRWTAVQLSKRIRERLTVLKLGEHRTGSERQWLGLHVASAGEAEAAFKRGANWPDPHADEAEDEDDPPSLPNDASSKCVTGASLDASWN